MKRLFLVVGTAIVILPWHAGAKAQADAIHWTASGSPLGPNLGSNGSASINAQNGVDGGIGLLPGNTTSGTNSGSVVALGIGYNLNPDGPTPTFGGPSANYSLSLTLRDDASGASGLLTFRGNLSGWVFSGSGPEADLTNTFLGSTTQTLKLGQNLYTVTIGPFVPPNASDEPFGNGGSISASIAVHPSVNSAPEPSSLVLACLGLPSLGLARRLRRRQTVDSTANKA